MHTIPAIQNVENNSSLMAVMEDAWMDCVATVIANSSDVSGSIHFKRDPIDHGISSLINKTLFLFYSDIWQNGIHTDKIKYGDHTYSLKDVSGTI